MSKFCDGNDNIYMAYPTFFLFVGGNKLLQFRAYS